MLPVVLAYYLSLFTNGILAEEAPSDAESMPGHLRPFGGAGASKKIDGYEGFPSAKHFYHSYVKPGRPMKMRGAAKLFPSFNLWEDDYFLNLNIGDKKSAYVHVETKKKEDRDQATDMMHFHEFLKIYNKTEHYMVQSVPQFLKGDVSIPGPLQCSRVLEKLVDVVMWFSSGGTKSVVHTDDVDNINCLIRGEKSFVLVDSKYKEHVPLDRSNGTFSTLDVDSVDFKKYPTMRHIKEYYHVHMRAGDCLYIPFRWVHQVRSVNRNIAVNFWWDARWIAYTPEMWDKDCRAQFDPGWTMREIAPIGLQTLEFIESLKKKIVAADPPLDPESFILAIDPEATALEKEIGFGFKMQLNQIFLIGDKDKDMLLTSDDVKLWNPDDMKRMDVYFRRYERILQAVEDHMREQVGKNGQELPPEYRGLHEEL